MDLTVIEHNDAPEKSFPTTSLILFSVDRDGNGHIIEGAAHFYVSDLLSGSNMDENGIDVPENEGVYKGVLRVSISTPDYFTNEHDIDFYLENIEDLHISL